MTEQTQRVMVADLSQEEALKVLAGLRAHIDFDKERLTQVTVKGLRDQLTEEIKKSERLFARLEHEYGEAFPKEEER